MPRIRAESQIGRVKPESFQAVTPHRILQHIGRVLEETRVLSENAGKGEEPAGKSDSLLDRFID